MRGHEAHAVVKTSRALWHLHDLENLEGVTGITPMNGLREVLWSQPVTHVRVNGTIPKLHRLAVRLDMLLLPRKVDEWDLLLQDITSWVRHVLAVSYDSSSEWSKGNIGLNLAYLTMIMLQEHGETKLMLTRAKDRIFEKFLMERFAPEHPLWRSVSINIQTNDT